MEEPALRFIGWTVPGHYQAWRECQRCDDIYVDRSMDTFEVAETYSGRFRASDAAAVGVPRQQLARIQQVVCWHNRVTAHAG
jgi:hypothetical protein